jgi:hypothetical protein
MQGAYYVGVWRFCSDFGARAEAHAALPVGVDRLPHRHR